MTLMISYRIELLYITASVRCSFGGISYYWELGAGRASKSAGRGLELAGGTEKKNSKGAFSVCNGTIGLVPLPKTRGS